VLVASLLLCGEALADEPEAYVSRPTLAPMLTMLCGILLTVEVFNVNTSDTDLFFGEEAIKLYDSWPLHTGYIQIEYADIFPPIAASCPMLRKEYEIYEQSIEATKPAEASPEPVPPGQMTRQSYAERTEACSRPAPHPGGRCDRPRPAPLFRL